MITPAAPIVVHIHKARRHGTTLSCDTIQSLSALVAAASAQMRNNKALLADAREHLLTLDDQIAAFLRDRSQPPRDPGIFLCQIAVHLRGLANELDGGGR
jgi:uncharacterized coiled-coil protein SlyX